MSGVNSKSNPADLVASLTQTIANPELLNSIGKEIESTMGNENESKEVSVVGDPAGPSNGGDESDEEEIPVLEE